MAHVSDKKKQVVAEFEQLMGEYPIIGALNMEGLPARQLQVMREQLRGTCVIRMTKRRLLKVAVEDAKKKKKGLEALEGHLKGMPALLFTKENPFTLYKILKKNKSPAPAKAGQTAPKDITIPAGPTPFAPGPIIGELGKFGLKTGVENGKVAVKEAKVVAKEGDTINASLAGLLTRLQIMPMEVGLDLTAVYEDGDIIPKSVLDIDEDQYLADLTAAAQGAINLGVEAGIHTTETVAIMLAKASGEARSLAQETDYVSPDTADLVLGKAQRQAAALASHLPEDIVPEELKGAAPAPEEPPQQEQPEAKPEEKPKEDPEGDTAAGMGALFG